MSTTASRTLRTGLDAPPDPLPPYNAWLTLLRGSPEFWNQTMPFVDKCGDMTRIRETYETLLSQYPDNASVQLAYIQHFLNNPALSREVTTHFETFLSGSSSVELWDCYLCYLRRDSQSSSARISICRAYDSALERIGHLPDSGRLWIAYIDFLACAETTTPWEALQKLTGLRRVYYKAITIPLNNVEELWLKLRAFERSFNDVVADRVASALSSSYTRARNVLKELSERLTGLDDVRWLPGGTLFLPAMPTFLWEDRALVGRWKRYLKWEEGNPLGFGDDERATLVCRVRLAYCKAVVRMRFYPEIWYMASRWLISVDGGKEALALLLAGLKANPDSFLLTFAYAEGVEMAEFGMPESRRDFSKVHEVYDRLFLALRTTLTPHTEYALPELVKSCLSPDEVTQREKLYSNAWINYLYFVRRAEGQAACREAFHKARKDDLVRWEVFEVAAMMEYRCNPLDGSHVASRIFEVGMCRFGKEVPYVLSYLTFLFSINDDNNSLALFESVIGTLSSSDAKPIWECWYRFRCRYDALETVLMLQRRMEDTFPDEGGLKYFGLRHSSHCIDAIAEHDLGFSAVKRLTAAVKKPSSRFPATSQGHVGGDTVIHSNSHLSSPENEAHRSDRKRPRIGDADKSPSNRGLDRNVRALPRRVRGRSFEREEKSATLPPTIDWFMRKLPPVSSFDGPVFTAESLINKLRSVIIPSSSSTEERSSHLSREY
ncbi:Suf-domain-containing protein [Mycena crocata]|nr:Suf-domain-containing protein [Mycena crocata]